jgi:hypothetical protein
MQIFHVHDEVLTLPKTEYDGNTTAVLVMYGVQEHGEASMNINMSVTDIRPFQ